MSASLFKPVVLRRASISAVNSCDSAVLRLGAAASVVQSALFVIIGIAALLLGLDRFVATGFENAAAAAPVPFRLLCVAFVAIAVLGLVITPAERALIEPANPALSRLGARLAYLGHAGTIAFFSWWLLSHPSAQQPSRLDLIAPIDWGVMFELVFVGAWVWIILVVARADPAWPRGFLVLCVVKALSFWFAFVAFVVNDVWMIAIGLGAVAFVTGPCWHLWFAQIARHRLAGSHGQ